MDTPISRAEHEEFRKRIEEGDNRQNRRIDELEENVRQISSMVSSIEKLAVNMENMAKEQERQGKRLETLEKRDGDKWRKAVEAVITAVISGAAGFMLAHLGLY